MQISINNKIYQLRDIPNICPICHHAIAPQYNSGVVTLNYKIDIAFQCPNCRNMFIGKYAQQSDGTYSYFKTWPIVPENIDFEKEIKEVSPMFVETYNQSIYAESNSLNQLTGIGLRKSLEFLIKDFLTSQKPENEESIKSSTLAQCINNFIDDHSLVEVSKRAVWLGNDETHYVRKWEDKDINDLKILIKLTVNWIHNIILKDKYIAEMS
ncbi:MAG: zf-TFIIB domain-containing protein [Sulfuricurvum sp.]|nr:zf-TFIIB domain-containing protein [Sulfuricurvum sp.]